MNALMKFFSKKQSNAADSTQSHVKAHINANPTCNFKRALPSEVSASSSPSPDALILAVTAHVGSNTLVVPAPPGKNATGHEMCAYSILSDALMEYYFDLDISSPSAKEHPPRSTALPTVKANSPEAFAKAQSDVKKAIRHYIGAFKEEGDGIEQTSNALVNAERDRAIGALVGLVLGDAIGAPLEFLPATGEALIPPDRASKASSQPLRPHLNPRLCPLTHELVYFGEANKFNLLRGQWTDDASMALCLADSLIVCGGDGKYNGGDCRTRYLMWWLQGYNNAFRYDDSCEYLEIDGGDSNDGNESDKIRVFKTSCGLGGNISKSFDELRRFSGQPASNVPAHFTPQQHQGAEDAGNGSIMRLAAVPIRFSHDVQKAMEVAMETSYSTHPGPDAAVCCAFLTYVVCCAIRRNDDSETAKTQETPASFLDATIDKFLTCIPSLVARNASLESGFEKLERLLKRQPPSPAEAVWDWRPKPTDSAAFGSCEYYPIKETLASRGAKYNGYPVSAGYFGSYCMDGLAMALWAFDGSDSFCDAILRVVNLLGDCDTTAAIAGQIAGAFYGYSGISAPNHFEKKAMEKKIGSRASTQPNAKLPPTMGQVFLQNLEEWDGVHEIELRAILLHNAASKS